MMTKQRTKLDKVFKKKLVELSQLRGNAKQKQATLSIFEWIESWYNRRRRHSSLGYKTIEEYQIINSNFKHAA